MTSTKKSRVYSVFDDEPRPEIFDINSMKVKGYGFKKLTKAQETISDLLDETKSYDIFTVNLRLF